MSSRLPQVPQRHVTTQLPLRWSDSDSLRHINNVVYLQLLEEARVRFFGELARAHDGGLDFGLVAARHEIDYLRELYYSTDPVTIRTWVDSIGRSSFAVAYIIYDQSDNPVAAAKTVVVSRQLDGSGPLPVPDWARSLLESYLPS